MGCTCAPARAPKPTRILVPTGATNTLINTGIPISILRRDIFPTINPAIPSSSVLIAQEWLQAPSMTMVSLNQSIAANADDKLVPFMGNQLPPLERDFAICARTETNHIEFPVPTAATYPLPTLVTGADFFNALNDMNRAIWGTPIADPAMASLFAPLALVRAVRANAEITSISLTPGTTPTAQGDGTMGDTTFNLTMSVTNLNVRVAYNGGQYDVHLDTLGVICPGVISAPTGSCGEVVVSCVAPTVTTTGWSTDFPLISDFPFSNILPDVLKGELTRFLTGGVLLHFQNRVVTSLAFVTDGDTWLQLKGTATNSCSPIPVPRPPEPPTRGLARIQTDVGFGQLVGEFGNVIPFEIRPEVKMDWENAKGEKRPFFPIQQLEGTGTSARVFASQVLAPLLPQEKRFVPISYELDVRAGQFIPKACYQRPLVLQRLILENGNYFVERTDEKGKRSLSAKAPMDKSAAMVQGIDEVSFEKDIAPMFEQAKMEGFEVPNLESRSDEWTRVKVLIARPPPPYDSIEPRLPPLAAPIDIAFWINRNRLEIVKQLDLELVCDEASMREKVVGEVIFSMPRVVLDPFMVDSAEFPSEGSAAGTGIGPSVPSPLFTRQIIHTSRSTSDTVELRLTQACLVRRPGQPVGAPCWSGSAMLPERGLFRVTDGVSGTTASRMPIRTTIATANMGLFGARVAAVQGITDRGAIEAYTAVPVPYVQAGLASVSAGAWPLDFRGLVYADWEHDQNLFTAPGRLDHVRSALRSDWAFPTNTEYFADWPTDQLVLKSRLSDSFSYCPRPEEVFTTPLTVRVAGARAVGSQDFSAGRLLNTGVVDQSGRYQLSVGRPASGDFHNVILQ